MPVLVGLLSSPTFQDQEDLQKIYLDAPADMFPPFFGAAQLIETTLADGALLAGRFNDRLLGAARLERGKTVWHLSHLCVRKPTRRRGVAAPVGLWQHGCSNTMLRAGNCCSASSMASNFTPPVWASK